MATAFGPDQPHHRRPEKSYTIELNGDRQVVHYSGGVDRDPPFSETVRNGTSGIGRGERIPPR